MDDPPFTAVELQPALRAYISKKAPGPDGLIADLCRVAINTAEGIFLAIAKKCLSLEYFLTQCKVSHVVAIGKPGKQDYTHRKSYRPIGLLSVLGKIVEKLLVKQLQWHVLSTLSDMQCGSVPQRGTEDPLCDQVIYLTEETDKKNFTLLVSLDMEGAFDNVW
ncbi:Retrovirus-related Pol polyprotein from type-1 retrotransposable element R1 [Eumeta japonica]|uniref:Retrovirus-related Pol polyprotein from type-1 retrotransposable element R1 n=1 Tax=Eumeta variegata TaxID=151549 RepID=A0A4C1WV81_EUMVA|nr:Retrovirus-related Pol polyprotein from type-1 retrotransposable element R1 [Eumeta japonica]